MKSLPTSAHGVTRPNNFGACSFRVTHVLRGLEFMPVVSQLLCGLRDFRANASGTQHLFPAYAVVAPDIVAKKRP